MSDQDKRSRDLELLKGAVQRNREAGRPEEKGAPAGGGGGGRPGMMYRGQPVAGRGSGGAPGAPTRGGSAQAPSSPGDSSDVKTALKKLTNLFNDGLISQSEFDAKRSEILDRI